MNPNIFTLSEARDLVGKQFEARSSVVAMPAGTRGAVTGVRTRPGGYMVVLKWRNADSRHSLEGWFNKDQFLRDFLPTSSE